MYMFICKTLAYVNIHGEEGHVCICRLIDTRIIISRIFHFRIVQSDELLRTVTYFFSIIYWLSLKCNSREENLLLKKNPQYSLSLHSTLSNVHKILSQGSKSLELV